MCIGVLPACMFVHYEHTVSIKAREGVESPVELQVIVICYVGTWNQVWVL